MGIRFSTLALGLMAVGSTLLGVALFWTYQKSNSLKTPPPLDEGRLYDLMNEFGVENPVLFRVEVPQGVDPKRPPELVDPKTMFPDPERSSQLDLKKVMNEAESCAHKSLSSDPGLRKLQQWFGRKCSTTRRISESLWKSPPLIHPQGGSWAFFLFQQGYGDQQWLEAQAKYLHILELRHLHKKDPSPLDKVVADLTPASLERLLKVGGLILTPSFALVSSYFSNDYNSLLAYSRANWDAFLAKKDLRLSENDAGTCALQGLSFCWDFAVHPPKKINPKSLLLMMLMLVTFLSGVIFVILWRRATERDRFIENQQLLMQTVAHELRTPVTSLNLVVEAIRSSFESLPSDTKTDFLHLAAISDKMNRIVHFSRQYLAVLRSEGQFRVNPVVVDSLNDLVLACVEDQAGDFEFLPLNQDVRVRLDPYWFSICLGILLSNALSHGKPPVKIGCEVEGDDLLVWVQDSGEGPALNLSQLVSPKVKPSVKGLGLGLSLVNRIVSQAHGKLSLTLHPTKFMIRFKGVAIGEDTRR